MTDSTLVASTGSEIIEFDKEGNQKRVISKRGRSSFEYIEASIVRVSNNFIYTWCPYLMKFIVYDHEGNGISECHYDSALFDFVPYDSCIYIYTAGLRDRHIVDVLDFSSGNIIDSLVTSSKEHQVLLMQTSVAPLMIYEDDLYFIPRDCLDIYRYSLSEKHCVKYSEIHSSSFISKPFTLNSVDGDILQTLSYVFKNSYTIGLSMDKQQVTVLTMEGSADVHGDMTLSNNALYSSLYKKNEGEEYDHFIYTKPVNQLLVSSFRGNIYCIVHDVVDSNDIYNVAMLSD